MGSSPFYRPTPQPGEPPLDPSKPGPLQPRVPHVEPPQEKKELFPAMQHKIGGPSEKELQDWYYELDTLAHEDRLSRHIQERLLDLRDEIYRYLR